jgi:hypothetical protein
MVMTPGFWLLRPKMATTLVCPVLNWKWMRPIGKTKTSPALRTLVKRRFPEGECGEDLGRMVQSQCEPRICLKCWGLVFCPYWGEWPSIQVDLTCLWECLVRIRRNHWQRQAWSPCRTFHSQILHGEGKAGYIKRIEQKYNIMDKCFKWLHTSRSRIIGWNAEILQRTGVICRGKRACQSQDEHSYQVVRNAFHHFWGYLQLWVC